VAHVGQLAGMKKTRDTWRFRKGWASSHARNSCGVTCRPLNRARHGPASRGTGVCAEEAGLEECCVLAIGRHAGGEQAGIVGAGRQAVGEQARQEPGVGTAAHRTFDAIVRPHLLGRLCPPPWREHKDTGLVEVGDKPACCGLVVGLRRGACAGQAGV